VQVLLLEDLLPDLVGRTTRRAAHSGIWDKRALSPLMLLVQVPFWGRSCDYNRGGLRQHHVNHSTPLCLHLKPSQSTQCRWKLPNRVN